MRYEKAFREISLCLEGEAEVEIRGQSIGQILKGEESHSVAMELELDRTETE